ncbi:hypothetical protein ACFQY7_32255 [Actinomadura luteofluorescens]|uniref:Uncharacterized protein n=1 Tax=Actinomadura luteofluorescens TaxID=46163 RepID=A0A7Y9JI10_9ACTN|nr:hypothetical protein [Actinomadura luteofluorescens]NYD49510.1 hypothetical protein [Actinomadura luteofluorescens]
MNLGMRKLCISLALSLGFNVAALITFLLLAGGETGAIIATALGVGTGASGVTLAIMASHGLLTPPHPPTSFENPSRRYPQTRQQP